MYLNTVERRFKRRRYKRKVSLREYFRASGHFYYVVKSQFRRKNLILEKKSWLPIFLLNRRSTVLSFLSLKRLGRICIAIHNGKLGLKVGTCEFHVLDSRISRRYKARTWGRREVAADVGPLISDLLLLLVGVVLLHNPIGIFDGPVDDLLKSLRI